MKKHVKNSPILKTMLHAACLSTAMAVPSYVWAVEVGVGVGAGVKSGARSIDINNSVGTGVVTDSRRTGVSATGTGSLSGTAAATGTGGITGSGTGPANSTGTMGRTGGITDATGMGAGNSPGTTGTPGMTGTPGTTGPGIGDVGTGRDMDTRAGQMPGPVLTPSGLDGNVNQNSQMLPDATRGLERAEDRMNMEGDANGQATVKTKASTKAGKNTRNRSNSTTK